MKASLVVMMSCCLVCTLTNNLDTTNLHTSLADIKTGIGVDFIQNEYNKLPHTTIVQNGTNLLNGIRMNLKTSLEALAEVLTEIKQEVVSNENKFTTISTLPLCCQKTGNYNYDPNFRKEVDFSTACVTMSHVATSNAKYPHKGLSDVMKTQYNNNKNVLWQHYGTTNGASIIYPSTFWTNCDSYDPRFRSAFAETASQKKKDVVIVIDHSFSMRQPSGVANKAKIVIAKEAAQTVIRTLNPNDRFAVVFFSDDVIVPSSCYNSTLTFASKANIEKLTTFVSQTPDSDSLGSNFTVALIKAFFYLSSSNEGIDFTSRDQLILFLVDDASSDATSPGEIIRNENAKLQNRVIIFTYLIGGTGVGDATKTQLAEMASQIHSNATFGAIRPGHYTFVAQEQHATLEMEMATFYIHLPRNMGTDTTYTIPYVDPFSERGLITSMCMPVTVNSVFNGVVCTDVKLSELLKEVEYFREGYTSYGFLIDETGRTLVHPLLPDANFVTIDEDPVLVDISNLERSQGSEEIILSMKRRESGHKTLPSVFYTIPRGRLINEGSRYLTTQATFFWGPVPLTNFVVCIVLGDETYSEITDTSFLNSTELDSAFMYHDRSLQKDTYADCRFNSRVVTLAKSSIKFSPSAFTDPYQYIDENETQLDITRYTEYLTRKTDNNPGFKAGVRPNVLASYKMEQFWKGRAANHLAWRYIGSKSGFIRAYPGVLLTKNYDHEKRTWWRQTVSHPGIMYITPPYEDAWGSGILLTLAHTIYKKGTEQVTAVVGTDFPLEYFSWFVDQNLNPACNNEYKCMIIDDSGFLVMHQSFKGTRGTLNFKDPIHITEQEPVIAKALQDHLIMNSNECQDYSENIELHSYRITLPATQSRGLSFGDTGNKFELRPVSETNIFVLRIRIGSDFDNEISSCNCETSVKPDSRKCTGNCACLCYVAIDFNSCKREYSINSQQAIFPCSARLLDTSSISVAENLDNYESCFDPKCSSKKTNTACFTDTQCSWCEFTDQEILLEPQCCSLKGDCSFGKTKSTNRDVCIENEEQTEVIDRDKNNTGVIIGVIIGVLVVVAVVIVIALVTNRYRKMSEKAEDPYLNAIPSLNDLREYNAQNYGFEPPPHQPVQRSSVSDN